MTEDARQKFDHDQPDVHGKTQERGAQAAFQAIGRHPQIINRERAELTPKNF
jgi:hypothetical protein